MITTRILGKKVTGKTSEERAEKISKMLKKDK